MPDREQGSSCPRSGLRASSGRVEPTAAPVADAINLERGLPADWFPKRFHPGHPADTTEPPRVPNPPPTKGDPPEPSVGLEPTTPSLPWRAQSGIKRHGIPCYLTPS